MTDTGRRLVTETTSEAQNMRNNSTLGQAASTGVIDSVEPHDSDAGVVRVHRPPRASGKLGGQLTLQEPTCSIRFREDEGLNRGGV